MVTTNCRKRHVNPFLKLLTYFWGPIPWMIEAAAVLSALVRHWPDFFIILVLLVANAVVGFWEEFQAGNAIAALKAKLALQARVKRDGQWTTVPARELVPGDLIRLRLGDIVPADASLLEGDPVEVDQSALTGESLPGHAQDRRGGLFRLDRPARRDRRAGLRHRREDVFRQDGAIGRTAHTVSHFQKAVLKIGDYLIVMAVVLVVLILAVALFRGDKLTTTLQFALVLTVAAIPVAMPTVLSVTMAVGARLLAPKQAIVSRLAAIEELAGMDVLCSDKTGTLTQNKLTLGEPFCVGGVQRGRGDPGRRAGIAGGEPGCHRPGGAQRREGQGCDSNGYQVIHFQPFDPVHKRTEATVKGPDGQAVQGDEGRAPGDPGPGGQRGAGQTAGRKGGQRVCRPRFPLPGRGPHR